VFALIAAEQGVGRNCQEAWHQPNHGGNTLSEHQSKHGFPNAESAQAWRAWNYSAQTRAVADLLMTLVAGVGDSGSRVTDPGYDAL